MRTRLVAIAVALLVSSALPATSAMAQEPLPADEVPVLHPPAARGGLVLQTAPDRAPSEKVIDGDASDWIGEAARVGGQSRYDAGELVHTDFLYDAYGADDGTDAQRITLLGELGELGFRADALFQAAGAQFDVPPPVGALEHYGDDDGNAAGDLAEVRVASDGQRLLLLVQLTRLVEGETAGHGLRLVLDDVALDVPLDGPAPDGVDLAIDPATNTVELAVPLADRLAVVSTLDGRPVNAAFRSDEPVAGIYNDQRQALAFLDGDLPFAVELDVDGMVRGRSETVALGPGYHERTFRSDPAISTEDQPEQGEWQRYGLYVPTSLDPAAPVPATWFLHYRGGKAHSGIAWSPNLAVDLGEDNASLVVAPHGRGTSRWYAGIAHTDFWEVYADVHELFDVDPTRRWLSGYSMGGMGTWLFATLYPDLFAAGFSQSGAVTAGLWPGLDPDTCGCVQGSDGRDGDALLTFRLLGNLRHFPIAIDHGTTDELVPITTVQAMSLRLLELGYRYWMTTYPGWEHYTQAIVDEWESGASYLAAHPGSEGDPRQVTYSLSPAMVAAVNSTLDRDGLVLDHDPDGAWWVDDIEARDPDPSDPTRLATVDAISHALPGVEIATEPVVGVADPQQLVTPFVRHGQAWTTGVSLPQVDTWEASLTGVASVTFDVARMGFTTLDGVVGDVSTDGVAEVRLANLEEGTVVRVDGTVVDAPDGRVTVPSGEHAIALSAPAPAADPVPPPQVDDGPAEGPASAPLPATGAGAALAGVLLLGAASTTLRRRGSTRQADSTPVS